MFRDTSRYSRPSATVIAPVVDCLTVGKYSCALCYCSRSSAHVLCFLPSKDDISAFSDVTSNSAGVVSAASTLPTTGCGSDEQLQALRYVRGRSFFAATVPEAPEVKRLEKAQLAIRIAALKDLQAYAKALGQAG